jgi:hypothetical protein
MSRRAYERYPVELEVTLRKLEGTSTEIDATVISVSIQGLGIIVGQELQSGTLISIEWKNPPFYFNGEPVTRGTIVNLMKLEEEQGLFRLGVRLSDQDSSLIQSLLNWVNMRASIEKRAQIHGKRSSERQKRIRF